MHLDALLEFAFALCGLARRLGGAVQRRREGVASLLRVGVRGRGGGKVTLRSEQHGDGEREQRGHREGERRKQGSDQ